MTRVTFYLLAESAPGDRFQLTCRLVERIHAEGLGVYVQVGTDDEARHLDRLLWTFRQQSFLPHGVQGEADAELTPILIGREEIQVRDRPVLINLTNGVPAGFDRFERLCEVVDHEPERRAAARARYRHYRQLGLSPEHHEIRL
ncbi:DNA polymerase III subunit chi [Thioalkalicoccus limnaeus]|uniref:DNA polymerase III subunit chi n=1 Tax=Thioalkalicoccus limnaeus TaxID=120681 RepID=A0ABV4BFE6_9GAMM